jgi:hypothetical protein
MRGEPALGNGRIQQLRRCPGHVHAAAKLIEAIGHGEQGGQIGRAVRDSPGIEQWDVRSEEQRANCLSGSNLTNPNLMAPDSIKVVVRNVSDEASTLVRRRRCDDWWRKALKAAKHRCIAVLECGATRCAGDKRLKKARRCRRPIACAVVAGIVEANGDEENAMHEEANPLG